jgi:phosphate/phosphite/phosphonate ABC transporter binding protein
MTCFKAPLFPANNASVKTIVIACIIIALSITVILSCQCIADKSDVNIDFHDVIKEDNNVSAASANNRPVLRMAVAAMISPQITNQFYMDLLHEIGDSVGDQVEFVQRKTYAEVNDLLEKQEIDLAFVCSGPYVAGHAKFGMEIIAVPVVGGEKVYYSYILAARDSSITSLDGLKGKRFAYTDPRSNTGCLVPQYMLLKQGHSPETFFGETFYTYAHDNSIKAIADGLADGAAVDSLIWEFFGATNPTYTKSTKIIAKSPPYGMPPVVVHPELNSNLKNRLQAAFLSLHKHPESARILKQLHIDRFEKGDDAQYDSVRDMEEFIKIQDKPK